ncbi:TetR/AcrR family transcriptional regulator C-terminal domain-containing protein [Slackia heliotrinireducens]|uniref:TetR/AcrR family transcriptional regulator C-terminal domain-containing protein n=1 Tax=Slackia heliotrinireducens TaxID=84110 RepID=UPI0033149E61
MKARKRLIKAIGHRLETTPIDQIKVANLLEDADISKQTFYRLYPDKYELLKDYYHETIVLPFYQEHQTIRDMYWSTYQTLRWFRDHRNVTRNMFFSKDSFALKAYFRDLCIEENKQIWSALGADMDDARMINALKIYSYGNASFLMDWFKTDMTDDLRQMADCYFWAMPVGMFWNNPAAFASLIESAKDATQLEDV